MKILLVYPQYPITFWSFKHILKFVSKKSAYPPLGLLTVAAMLPKAWEKKVVDMNCNQLTDKDIKWADYVFISAMVVQKESVHEVVRRCRDLGRSFGAEADRHRNKKPSDRLKLKSHRKCSSHVIFGIVSYGHCPSIQLPFRFGYT